MPLTNYGNIAVYRNALKTVFPTTEQLPESYTTERVASAPVGGYTTYAVTESGFYKVSIRGAGGVSSAHTSGGGGGAAEQIIYMYKGQKCVLWAGAVDGGVAYPGGQTNQFGGHGASGYNGDESGGGGGSPATPRTAKGYDAGSGSAGSGFLAGFEDKTLTEQSLTAGSLTRSINYAINAGVANFVSVTSYVMAAGGGGGSANNGSNRGGGAGGGAFGNGGTAYISSVAAESGPAGTWGKGGDAGRYSGGGAGAWAIIDFSRTQVATGLGGGAVGTNGKCELYKIIAA